MNHQECGRWSEGFSSGKKWGSQCKPRECIESEEMGDFCDLQRSGGLKQESVTFDSLWGVTKGKAGGALKSKSKAVLPPSRQRLSMARIAHMVSSELELGCGCSVYG